MDFQLTDSQIELQERATAVGESLREQAAQWDRDDSLDYQAVVEKVRDAGLLGLAMPKEYGGQGFTAFEYLLVVEALFRSSQFWIVGEPMFATTGPGPSMLLLAEQDATREKYMRDVVAGHKQCAIALTEPDYGSDLSSLVSTATETDGGFIINGSKNFVTGATENQLYAAFVRFDGIPGAKGIGAVILEEGMEGLTIEKGPDFLGCRGVPHGDVKMKDVFVPTENVICGPGRFADLMGAFNMERLHNCGFNLGMASAAYDEARKRVEEREAFGRQIIEFQSVYHALVDMWNDLQALQLLAYKAASTATAGNFPRGLETTSAKLFGARIASGITVKSLELHGGYGATLDFPIQRIHRDVVSTIVAGGAPPVLRNGIAGDILDRRFSQRKA